MGITIFGLLFSGIGLLMFVRGFGQFRTSRASREWPSTDGQIVDATVEMKIDSDEDGTTRRYSPRIIYTYSVYGQTYTSDQVVVGARRWYPSHAAAEARLRYRPGDQVAVHYDPEKPAQAVLEAGAARGVWGTLIIGIGFAFFGVIALADGIQDMLTR